ncbi:threonine dehydrogenase-like Zn-dependent dehydrogenase [Microbacterium proteolyticum]|nr:threonine dehydrogenase-like Zn-dependent dehydrogenase [Microbacterium sp. SORGH_AS_0344]MDQ1169899.1 threonine dehydrogenase-like Zn-dependent dehydrogenase [Microbacterium proteolyticum]
MRAMTYRGPYKVRVENKPDPRIEHPNDAIVRVERAAICGSDLHLYHGMIPDTRIGHTFGHEFIGRVEEVGSSVENLSVGDRVMVPFNIFCGTCFFCARGLFSNCHNVNANATAVGGIYGYSHTAPATTADRRSSCASRSPMSAPGSSPTGCTTKTRCC